MQEGTEGAREGGEERGKALGTEEGAAILRTRRG